MPEIKKNTLEVGTNGAGEVVINHPDLQRDEHGVGHIVFSVEQARSLGNLMLSKAADAAVERGDFKASMTNYSRREWSLEECQIMVNAALCKLIQDRGGIMHFSVPDLFAAVKAGTLALALSDDDKVLTVTQVKEQ